MSAENPQPASSFAPRHIGIDAASAAKMLETIGAASIHDLIDQTVPASIRTDQPLGVPDALGEAEALARLAEIAASNTRKKSLIGQGYYGTHTPAVIQRNI